MNLDIRLEVNPHYEYGFGRKPIRVNNFDKFKINGHSVYPYIFDIWKGILNNISSLFEENPEILTDKYDCMLAKVKITNVLSQNIFAHFEAILLSNDSITAQTSGEGKSSVVKTANKGDIIYIDSSAVPNFKPEIGQEKEIYFVQSLYAKNNQKPIVLHLTSIL